MSIENVFIRCFSRHFHPEMLSEHEAALSAEAEAGLLNNNVGAVAEFPVLQLPALPHHHLGTHSQRALVSPEVNCSGCYLHFPLQTADW